MLNELNELAKQQYVSAYEVATIYVALGNSEQAFQLLEKAYAEHSFHLVNLNVCHSSTQSGRIRDFRIWCSALAFLSEPRGSALRTDRRLARAEVNRQVRVGLNR